MPELTITVAWPSADAPEVRIAGVVDAASAGRVQMSIVTVAMGHVTGPAPTWCLVDLTQVTAIDAVGLDALRVAGRYLGEHGVMMRTHNSWAVDRAMGAAGMLGRFGPPPIGELEAFDDDPPSARRGWFRLRRTVLAGRSGAHWAR